MDDDQKENGQETEEAKPLTLFEEKMKSLLVELDELLEQVGGDYGPILMEELQNRLELIVKNFNDEIHTLFTDSFKKWRVTDSQLRGFVKVDVKVPKPKMAQKKPKKTSTPEFIKDVEFGPIRSK